MSAAPVLVVGAGPVGLVLACDLAWRGVPVRIIEAAPEPSARSKAIGVLARTLELLENIGAAEEIAGRAVGVESIDLHAGRRRIASLDTTLIESRYNRIYTIEQSETERILIRRLSEFGVQVDWSVRLETLRPGREGVAAALRHVDGRTEEASAPWLVGCDGVHSTVRETLEIPFEGERYSEAFDLADVRLEGPFQPARSLSIFLSRKGIVFLAPLPGERRFRVIVDEPPGSAEEHRHDPDLEDFRGWWSERVEYPPAREAVLADAEWLSRFRIHRRMAAAMRESRALLAGDAAHVHSPAGAQGMNRGMQDAVNLAWKLALVTRGSAPESLLNTYPEERLPVTRAVLRATHLLTRMATLDKPFLQAVRARVMSALLSRKAVSRRIVNLAAGLYTNYRGSSIVGKRKGRGLAPGDRAPDAPCEGPEGSRLYDHLRHPEHTLLVFEGPRPNTPGLARLREELSGMLAVHGGIRPVIVGHADAHSTSTATNVVRDPEGALHAAYALPRGGVCLLRPDRYVAACSAELDVLPVRDALALLSAGPCRETSAG